MKRVMVFGTFDGLHEGHRDLFKQARACADETRLIVSVARDSAVMRIKGRAAQLSEEERKAAIEKSGLADEVVLGDESGYIAHIKEAQPDIIALGYDQEGEYVDSLSDELAGACIHAEVRRMQPHWPEIYKSSKLRSE